MRQRKHVNLWGAFCGKRVPPMVYSSFRLGFHGFDANFFSQGCSWIDRRARDVPPALLCIIPLMLRMRTRWLHHATRSKVMFARLLARDWPRRRGGLCIPEQDRAGRDRRRIEIIGKPAAILGVDPVEFFRRPTRSGSRRKADRPFCHPVQHVCRGGVGFSFPADISFTAGLLR